MTAVSNQMSGVSKSVFCFTFYTVLVALCVSVEAQQAKKMARIGYLSPQSGPPPTLMAFKEGLRELGWVEGKQIELEYRYAGGQVDKLSEFATELVRLKVDVIVAGPSSGAGYCREACDYNNPYCDGGGYRPCEYGPRHEPRATGSKYYRPHLRSYTGAGREKPGAS